MENESIDVVITVYKSLEYLEQCFDSLFAQTFKDFKVFVVFDDSGDDSLLLLQKIQNKFGQESFDIIISQRKNGPGAARDLALDSGKLKGKYVIFPDSDDYFEPTYLLKMYELAETTKSDITFCGFDRISASTGRSISKDMIHNDKKPINNLPSYQKLIYLNPAPWNKLYKRDLFGKIRFTSIKRAEDLFCFLKIIPFVKTISFVNEVLYHYRVRTGSASSVFTKNDFAEVCNGFLETKQFYKENDVECHKYSDFLSASAFMRLGIAATVRATLDDPKSKRIYVDLAKRFLNENFPKWYRNKYLSFSKSFIHGKKTLLVWIAKTNFRTNCFGLFISCYKGYTKITKRDIKW
jgi:glycosyltransferase EpsH